MARNLTEPTSTRLSLFPLPSGAPHKVPMLRPAPCDGVGRCGLWETTESKGRAPMARISVLAKDEGQTLCSFLSTQQQEAGSLHPSSGPSPDSESAGAMILDFKSQAGLLCSPAHRRGDWSADSLEAPLQGLGSFPRSRSRIQAVGLWVGL